MSLNNKMRQFDTNLINYINTELENGLPISAVVLSLDKCLCSAKLAEERAIMTEREEVELIAKMEEANSQNIEPENINTEIDELEDDEYLDPAWKM